MSAGMRPFSSSTVQADGRTDTEELQKREKILSLLLVLSEYSGGTVEWPQVVLNPTILGRASSGDKHPSEADQSYAAYYEHNAIEHGRA
jgi:hypothetical protein